MIKKSSNTEILDEELDKIDRKIINILQKNNQITNLELAKIVNISPPPCLRRVRRLRKLGIIIQDVCLIDPFKLGQHLIVFVGISLKTYRDDLMEDFEHTMLANPEVKQCYFISGEVDYLLVVHISNIDAYNAFVRKVLLKEKNIKLFRSSFCLTRIKFDTSVILSDC